MTRRRPASSDPLPLFGWTPPEPVVAFAPQRVKAATLANEMSRVISETLSEQDGPREDIARRMSEFLGVPVSLHMLDKYASEAAEDHVINLVRFIALLHATGDRRPLQHIAQMFGWAVMPADYEEVIAWARAMEVGRQAVRRQRQLRQSVKKKGLI